MNDFSALIGPGAGLNPFNPFTSNDHSDKLVKKGHFDEMREVQGSWSFQGQIQNLKTDNLRLQTEKTELQTMITELKAKNDIMEHEALSTRHKFVEEVQRVEA